MTHLHLFLHRTGPLAALAAAALCTFLSADAPAGAKRALRSETAKQLARIEREAFEIDIKPASAKTGKEAVATVTLKSKGDFHVNPSFPHHLKLVDVPAGLRFDKTDFTKDDAKPGDKNDKGEPQSIAFVLTATPEKPGRYLVNAKLRTSVCDEKQCIMRTEPLVIKFRGK